MIAHVTTTFRVDAAMDVLMPRRSQPPTERNRYRYRAASPVKPAHQEPLRGAFFG